MVTVNTRLHPTSSRSLTSFIALVLLWGSSGSTLSAQPRGRGFFSAAPPGHAVADVHRRARPAPKRSRTAAVRADLLAADDNGTTPPLDLNLFDDLTIRVRVQRVDRHSPRQFVWHGRLEGMKGHATFASTDGVLAGTVFTDDATFEVSYVGDGLYEVSELDPTAFPTDDPTADIVPPPGASSPAAAAVADSAAQEDILVVWTPAARVAAGGAAAIQSLIDLAIANANTAYANSGVAMRLRLVYKGEVSYGESSISTDLSRLASTADGYIDGVHALRDRYGADIVSMVGAGYTTAGSCGIGYLMSSVGSWFAGSAFNVVDWSCAAGNLSMAHEIGHNQGLHHDPAHSDGPAAYPYSYGYIDPGCGFRTVMAYGSCRRVTQFSSPTHHYAGLVTGTSTQDNARTLNNTAATVANFRQQVSSSCSYSLSAQSLTAAAGGQSASVSVTAAAGCGWTASSSASWMSITSGASGSGSGSVTLSVAANTGTSSRSGMVTIAGTAVTVTQEGAACSYTLSPTSAAMPSSGGTVSTSVSAGSCSWSIASNTPWIEVSGSASRSSTGTVSLVVAPNTGTTVRRGTVTIAGQTFTVTQASNLMLLGTARIGGGSQLLMLTSLSGESQPVPVSGTSYDVHPATGDLDGDGLNEVVVGLGAGGDGWVGVFDDAAHDFAAIKWFRVDWSAYNAANGSVFPAVGDLDGDGTPEIVLGLGTGGGGYLQVLTPKVTLDTTGKVTSFQVTARGWPRVAWPSYNSANGETHPAVGDFDGDGKSEIAVGLGRGGDGWIQLMNGPAANYSLRAWKQVGYAGYNRANGTTWPAAGDIDGDGASELVIGLGAGGEGWFVVWDDARADFRPKQWVRLGWTAYNTDVGETHPAVVNLDGDKYLEIVVAPGTYVGHGGWFQMFDDALSSHRSLGWGRIGVQEVQDSGAALFPATVPAR